MTDAAKVYLVGAGPGSPDLITVRGLRLLQRADVVVYTDSLVSEELVAEANPAAVVHRSAGMILEDIIDVMADAVTAGKVVVRLHTGDPAVFGATLEQMVRLRQRGIPYEIVPGVSSVFAAAAILEAELTVPELTQTVILTRMGGRTPVPEREQLRDLAAHHTTIALYLSATLAKRAVDELYAAGWAPDTPAAVVQKATWPDEKVVRTTLRDLVRAMGDAHITSHAMILVGWALHPALRDNPAHRSKLYDASFTHRFRRGVSR
ncbi:precorrin-4 C(11)-methyltransferase [Alicyclobacillus contaminans]|uniref:precorrin-4 C(11)-methyltransferase n=1 Tax=Alicyclobacillus contaminans TaxID=392016 RepID=UPI0003F58C30|nr:precorrin-4 C(11)-methyltransferase [Alicyclobacillus contaminans]